MRRLKTMFSLFLIIFIGLIINKEVVNAETKNRNLVNIYFFHSDTCSHCKSEIQLLDLLEEKYSNLKIYRYEIHQKDNNELFEQVQDLYQIKTSGVPLTIIGSTSYSGYKEEKSNIEFIKTIEYYSIYGYEDKVGELLQIETRTNYEVNENAPTLEDFMTTYGNYKLIGNLYTNDLDISLCAIILGTLSQLNIIKLISILLILILIAKIKEQKNKILLLVTYIGISFLLITTTIFSNELYTLFIKFIILILFIIGLLKYQKNKKTKYLYGNIIIGITLLLNYLENYFFNHYNFIFKDLLNLYNLSGFEKITYYINYIFAIGLINIIVIILIYCLKKQVEKIGQQSNQKARKANKIK